MVTSDFEESSNSANGGRKETVLRLPTQKSIKPSFHLGTTLNDSE